MISAGVMMLFVGAFAPPSCRVDTGRPEDRKPRATAHHGPTAPVTISAPTPPTMVTSMATIGRRHRARRKPRRCGSRRRAIRASSIWGGRDRIVAG